MTTGQVLILAVVVIVLGLVVHVIVVRNAAPDDPLIEESDEPLQVAGVKGGGERLSVARHLDMLRLRLADGHISYTD